jgi:predicted enzyme related to lactoylglutathione lyase
VASASTPPVSRRAIGKLGLENREAPAWRGAPLTALVKQRKDDNLKAGIGQIGQIARCVKDVKRAEAWYRDVLGLKHLYTFPSPIGDLAFFDCGGTRLMIEKDSGEVNGLHNDSVLYFRVPDINAAHDELRSRGVEFTDAPHMIARHPDGTEEWMAFFKDSEGGLLGIMSQIKP